MNPAQWATVLSISLFVGVGACLEVGYRIGRHRSEQHPELRYEGIGVLEGAVFSLLGLLLGFSFSGGTGRLDARRQLIIQEANAIDTAYLRLDLLPTDQQPEIRRLFREYLDARLRVYEKLPDLQAAERELLVCEDMQQEIWSKSVVASRGDPTQNATRLLLPALNDMMDVTTMRTVALHTQLPSLILILLVLVALVSGLLAGYAMAKRNRRGWLHILLFSGAIALTVYSVMDMDDPRVGFIRVNAADSALIHLRDSIR
jgi:hypothetical protein